MTRAAIYARYSTAHQNDRSIDDQVALCRDYAARAGWSVAEVFCDREISGSAVKTRPGYQAMLAFARAGGADVLLAEDLDRLVRNQAEQARLYEEMCFREITIHTVMFGETSEIHVGLNGTMNALQLKQTAMKVRRAQAGLIRQGKIGGGRTYGYRPTPGRPGEFQIDDAEAEVVRRIFADYLAGRTPRAIAAALNREGVRAPRGGQWNASTINGNFARGNGILLNALYVGRIVWNRQRFLKNPGTEKRVSRPNAESEWHRAAAPQLRILEDDIWNAAQALKTAKHHACGPKARAPARLLSGLIKCGSCGAGMASVARDKRGMRLQCSGHRERGACGSSRLVYRDAIERAVIGCLAEVVAEPDYLKAFVDEYNAERKRLAERDGRDRRAIERAYAEVARKLERAIDALLEDGAERKPLAARVNALHAEKERLAAKLAGMAETKPVALHPATLERYKADLDRLSIALKSGGGEPETELFAAVRALIASVTVHAAPAGGPVTVQINGRLGELIDPAFAARSFGRGTVVAGVRNIQSPTEATFTLRARAA
jgi:site-specific DNA recombinase